jgi:hypothetical protein
MYSIPYSPINDSNKNQRINYIKKKIKINGKRIIKNVEKYKSENKIKRIYRKNNLISK